MSTVYERAQEELQRVQNELSTAHERGQEEIRRVQNELNRLETRFNELRMFLRIHDELWPHGSDSDTGPEQTKAIGCRDSDIAEGNGPVDESEPEPETETERLAKQALAGHAGMRIRALYETMIGLGYQPSGHKPKEVLRTRLLRRAHLFQNDGGVFSLRSEA